MAKVSRTEFKKQLAQFAAEQRRIIGVAHVVVQRRCTSAVAHFRQRICHIIVVFTSDFRVDFIDC